jgi:hypothetical protein
MRKGVRIVTGIALALVVSSSAGPVTAAPRLPSGPGVPLAPTLLVRPNTGPAGTTIKIKGDGFSTICPEIGFMFVDANGVFTPMRSGDADAPSFLVRAKIPAGAATGTGTVQAWQQFSINLYCIARSAVTGNTQFTVTG